MQVLAAHRILSAPVVVGNGGAESSGAASPAAPVGSPGAEKAPEVCGFIDIRDLLSSFLHGGWLGGLENQGVRAGRWLCRQVGVAVVWVA